MMFYFLAMPYDLGVDPETTHDHFFEFVNCVHKDKCLDLVLEPSELDSLAETYFLFFKYENKNILFCAKKENESLGNILDKINNQMTDLKGHWESDTSDEIYSSYDEFKTHFKALLNV